MSSINNQHSQLVFLCSCILLGFVFSSFTLIEPTSAATTCSNIQSTPVFRQLTVLNVNNAFGKYDTGNGTEYMRADFTNTTVNAPVVDFTNTSSIQYVLSAPPGRRLIVERSITMNAFKFVLDETYISYRNNCLPNPCLNNGVCVEGVNTYRCNCPSTATGTNCELIINAAANYRFCPTAQQFYLSTTTKAVFIGFYFNFTLTPFSAPSAPVTLTIYSTNTTVATVIPATYTIPVGSNVKINISCLGKAEGTTFIRINTSSADPLWNRTTIPPTTLTVFNATLLNGTFPDNYQNGTNVTSTVQYVCCNPQLNPCQNGGTCVTRSDQRSYTCNCPSTTTGLHCEKSPWIVPTYYPNIAQVQNISSDVCVSFDGLVGASPEYSVNNVFFSVQGIYVRIGVTLNFAKRDSSQRKGVTFQNMRITLTPRLALNRTLSVIQNVTYINTTTNLPYNVTQPVLVALPPTYYQKYWGNVYFIGDAPNLIAAYRFAAVVDDSAAWGSQVISDAPRPVVLGHVYGDSLIEKYQDLSPTTQAVTSSIDLERGVIYLPRWHGIDTATLYTYQDALAQCAALPSASAGSPYTVCSKAALQATALRLNYSSCDRGWLSDVKFETLPNGDQVTKHLVGFLMNYVDEKCGNKTGFFGDDADPTKNPSGTGFYEDLKYLTGVYCCGSAPTVDLSYFVSTQFKIVAPLNHIFAVNYYSRYTSLTLALNYELKRETGAVSGTRFPLDLCVTFEDYTSNLQPRTNFASGSLDLLGNQLLLSANLTLQRTVSFSSLIISMSLRTGMTNPNLQFNLTTGTFSIRGVGGPGYGAPLSILPSAYQCAPSCSNVIGHPLTLTDFTATFNDGSGDKEYANNASCEWVIAPVAADRVSVKFTYLKTEDSVDYVEIWESNGAVATTLRGSYSGSVDTSTFVPIVSSGPTMIVRFYSNPSGSYPGFGIHYDGCNRLRRCAGHGFCNAEGGCTCDYEYSGPDCRSCFSGYVPSPADQCTDGQLRPECTCHLPNSDIGQKLVVRVRIDYSEIYSFEKPFLADIAASLSLDVSRLSRVVVLSVDATGFAIISFSIIPGRGLRPDERAVEFTSQLAHERSLLRTSFWGSRLDPGYNTTYEARAMTRCSDLVYREVCPSPLIPKPTEENNLWVYALAGLITGLIVSILMIMFVLYRRRTEHIRKLKKEARAALAREAEEKAEAEAREQERIRAMAEAEAEIAAHQLALEAGDDMDGSATFGGGKPNAKAAAGKGGALSKAAAGKGGAAAVGKTAAAAAIVAKDPKRKGKATAKDDVIEMSVLTDNPVPVYAGTNPLLSLLSDTPAAVENDYEQTEPFDDGAGAGAGGASGSGAQSFPMQDLFSPPPPAGTSSPAPAPTPVRTTATPVVTAPVPMSAAASKAAEAAYFSNPFAGLSDPSTDFKRDAYAPRKKTQDDDYSMMM